MRWIILSMMLGCFYSIQAQILADDQQAIEEKLKSSTKQVNQFFRRFNGEENFSGERLYQDDRKFRDRQLRKKYLPELFDQESISEPIAESFVDEMTDKRNPHFIDFHQSEWFAEVRASFEYKGASNDLLLFMKIQPQGQGFEWVIYDVAFQPFSVAFDKKEGDQKPFVHPMSHELGFMNLRKAFEKNQGVEQYTPDDYKPDFLTLFIFLMNQGEMKFNSVSEVKFHFFDINQWYFELSNFNRPGNNTGWLISNLLKINDSERQQLEQYLYGK